MEEFFFDYKKKNYEKDFKFVRDVGLCFNQIFKDIIKKKNKKNGKKKIKKYSIKKEEGTLSLICCTIEEQNLDCKQVEM